VTEVAPIPECASPKPLTAGRGELATEDAGTDGIPVAELTRTVGSGTQQASLFRFLPESSILDAPPAMGSRNTASVGLDLDLGDLADALIIPDPGEPGTLESRVAQFQRDLQKPSPPKAGGRRKRTRKIQGTSLRGGKSKFLPDEEWLTRETLLTRGIQRIIQDLGEIEADRNEFTGMIQQYVVRAGTNLQLYGGPEGSPFREPGLLYPVKAHGLHRINVAGSDGGLFGENLMGLEFTLVKAIVCLFKYTTTGFSEVVYYPNEDGVPNYVVQANYFGGSGQMSTAKSGLLRGLAEVSLLLEFLHNAAGRVHVLMVDGSVLPPPLEPVMAGDRELVDRWLDLVAQYGDLYRLCEERQTLLVGVVKDTTQNTLREGLLAAFPTLVQMVPAMAPFLETRYRDLFRTLSDTALCYKLMSPAQRTCAFDLPGDRLEYISRQIPGIIPSHLGFYGTYLKTNHYGLPIRLEFVSPRDNSEVSRRATSICSILLPLSSQAIDFALPAPQIEAHKRAALSEQEFSVVMEAIRREFFAHKLDTVTRGRPTTADPENLEEYKRQAHRECFGVFMAKRRNRMPFT
jgi:hypothetical protein